MILNIANNLTGNNVPSTKVPTGHRSSSPAKLRSLASSLFKQGSKEQKLLLDVAAEIEGSQQAYADLVDVNRTLRTKVERFEQNLG